ncbi:MAG TPA: response regulator [Thermotogota bacterium]|nr:response regulator [Thermotogota bacterium]HPJ88726.1 response regulator [Thermotogota bacterium]HPR97192.1 response regulator [Thermotogota bacterium]
MKNADRKNSVLIIDDTPENIKMLAEVLKPFYTVFFATDGLKGIEIVKTEKPDLIILDIMMEPIDGYEVCRRLKADESTSEIPIIFLTAVSDGMDEAKGFETGGVDYITKPFNPIVVLARIRNQMNLSDSMKELKRLYDLALDSNPITHLPGNNSIRNHITQLIENDENRAVFYVDLDNFKAYNDVYGFANGDRVILALSDIFRKTADELDLTDIFIGHIGGDDFVLTLPNSIAETYIKKFIHNFDTQIREYYTGEDLERGFIRTKNRQGVNAEFPIISVSIAGIDLEKNRYANYLLLSDACAALKHKAKEQAGSICLMDKRTAS